MCEENEEISDSSCEYDGDCVFMPNFCPNCGCTSIINLSDNQYYVCDECDELLKVNYAVPKLCPNCDGENTFSVSENSEYICSCEDCKEFFTGKITVSHENRNVIPNTNTTIPTSPTN
jgi:hypothetical protein